MNKSTLHRGMKAAFLCLSFLLATAIIVGGSAETAFAASYDAEDVKITQDGVTYTCDFMSDGTASIKKPAAADELPPISWT